VTAPDTAQVPTGKADAGPAVAGGYTDGQACIVATVDAGGPLREEHRKTVEAWVAQNASTARQQRQFIRDAVRAEVGPDVPIYVRIVPGYCDRCQGR